MMLQKMTMWMKNLKLMFMDKDNKHYSSQPLLQADSEFEVCICAFLKTLLFSLNMGQNNRVHDNTAFAVVMMLLPSRIPRLLNLRHRQPTSGCSILCLFSSNSNADFRLNNSKQTVLILTDFDYRDYLQKHMVFTYSNRTQPVQFYI